MPLPEGRKPLSDDDLTELMKDLATQPMGKILYARSLTGTIREWRKSWSSQRRKHELGPDDDQHWEEYLNSLTMAEVINNLEAYGEDYVG